MWWAAACDFFRRNHATVDGELLAAALANVISNGPNKTARVPLIAGVTNAGKSLVLDPLINIFGRKAVDFCPAQGASMALSSLATSKGMRFIGMSSAQRSIHPGHRARPQFQPSPSRSCSLVKSLEFRCPKRTMTEFQTSAGPVVLR